MIINRSICRDWKHVFVARLCIYAYVHTIAFYFHSDSDILACDMHVTKYISLILLVRFISHT